MRKAHVSIEKCNMYINFTCVHTSQSISGLNYECVVGSNTVIPATRVSDTTVVCNIGQGNEVSSIC